MAQVKIEESSTEWLKDYNTRVILRRHERTSFCNTPLENTRAATYQSPLPRVSPLPFPLESRLEAWPAAADAKLDGMCEGMIDIS